MLREALGRREWSIILEVKRRAAMVEAEGKKCSIKREIRRKRRDEEDFLERLEEGVETRGD